MPLASFKDLVIDAVDAHRLGAFWAAALGLTTEALDDGDVLLTGPTPQHRVWVNTVPEPVTVKQRVHLDVAAASVDDVLALGATPVDLESFSWKVLRDPEGGELCVFEPFETGAERPPQEPRQKVPDDRIYEVVVDAREHERIALWWSDVLGATPRHREEYSWVEGIPGAPFEALVFVPVPEPKTVKNRIHWDVGVPDLAPLVEAGATVVRPQDDEIRWTVMADPEGNEFCAFVEQP